MMLTKLLHVTAATALLGSLLLASGCAHVDTPDSGTAGTTTAPEPTGPIGEADGKIDGDPISPFDEDQPAIANLDPQLRAAVQQAATDAKKHGINVRITSGWRSARYQQQLLDDAVAKDGAAAAAKRVDPADQSHHVTGDAVDIGPTDADYWMIQHGTDYGLCQIYENEIWHFELKTSQGGQCPPMHADATQD